MELKYVKFCCCWIILLAWLITYALFLSPFYLLTECLAICHCPLLLKMEVSFSQKDLCVLLTRKKQNKTKRLSLEVCAYNPIYLGDREQEDHNSMSA
jgi:hypothetical protein